jgi:hypothetical protein
MAYGNQVKTDALSTVYDSEVYPLGSTFVQSPDENNAANSTHYGEKTWVFVFNDEASTAWAEGDLISIDTGDYAPYHGIVSAAAATVAGSILGAAGHAVAAGKYGWVVQRGVCECKGDGSVSQGEAIVSHTSGQVDTMGSGEEVGIIGVALEDDGSAGDLFTCKIAIPA